LAKVAYLTFPISFVEEEKKNEGKKEKKKERKNERKKSFQSFR
jgi:hypothetical protein